MLRTYENAGQMILLEGLDLAGKSTLSRGLLKYFESQGLEVRYSRNALVSNNPIALRADELRREKDAGLMETGALFLAAHLYDSIEFSLPPPGTVHLQDSSWLRTLAYHTLNNTRWIPTLVRTCSVYQPNFNAVLYLTAGLEARKERVLQREREQPEENDPADYLAYSEPGKVQRHDNLLMEITLEAYPQAQILDTSGMTPTEVLERSIDLLD